MSQPETYDIHPKDFYKILWLTPLYTSVAALVTSVALLFLGEALSEIFIIFSCAYGLIGYAAGSAVKRCLGARPIAPGYVLAMAWTLLGIAICQCMSQLISMMFFGEVGFVVSLTSALITTPYTMAMDLMVAVSFAEPIYSVVFFAQPLIAMAFAWQTLGLED